jgi:Zn-dependent protease
MLNETASTREDRPLVRAALPPISNAELLHNEVRQMVASVLAIETENFAEPSKQDEAQPAAPGLSLESHLVATFTGRLLSDSETAYQQLDDHLVKINHVGVFRETQAEGGMTLTENNPHTIHVLTGRINPAPRPWWPNAVLFVITLFTVLTVGLELALISIASENLPEAQRIVDRGLLEIWRGLPFALSILLILGAHEMGHYIAARRHNLAVTLPYFIPLPAAISLLGTMGAFIQLRQPMRNRKVLFDVGAAGPLVGLIFAIPILLIGLANLKPTPITGFGTYEGDSIIYAAAKIVTYGHFVPDGRVDICINCNQLAWAGWMGLLVTALNLIPIGQLDGGHVLYSLIGERARRLYYPMLLTIGALGIFASQIWLFWAVLMLFFGRIYATPLDMITQLDGRRRGLAIMTLIIFVLVFIPAPLAQQVAGPIPNAPLNSAYLFPLVGLLLSRLTR